MYLLSFDKYAFPIAPSKIKTKINGNNKTVELINDGEINILKSPGLTEYSFDLLLPNQQYPFAEYSGGTFRYAQYYLDILAALKRTKAPFEFTMSRSIPDGRDAKIGFQKAKQVSYICTKVTLEDYTIEDNVNEGTDIKVSVELKQYVPYGTKVDIIKKKKKKKKKSRSGKKGLKAHKYVIKKKDTLRKIAKKEMGDSSQWRAIYIKNKSILEKAAKKKGKKLSKAGKPLVAGTKITIPAVTEKALFLKAKTTTKNLRNTIVAKTTVTNLRK